MEAFSKYLLLYCLVCLWASAEFEVTSADPLQTDGPETNYVENVSDNEHCFHNYHGDVDKLPCPKGRRRARERGESSCLPCPFEVGGLQTFQPKRNDCDKCIRCSECGEGEEVSSNCTRRKDTECQPVVHKVISSTTDAIPINGTTQPAKVTAMETGNGSTELSNDHPVENWHNNTSPPQLNFYKIGFWCLTGVVILLVVCFSLHRWMKKYPASTLTRVKDAVTKCTSNCCAADSATSTDDGQGRNTVNDASTAAGSAASTNSGQGHRTRDDAPGGSNPESSVSTTRNPTNQESINNCQDFQLEAVNVAHEEHAPEAGAELDDPANTSGHHVEDGTQEEQASLLHVNLPVGTAGEQVGDS